MPTLVLPLPHCSLRFPLQHRNHFKLRIARNLLFTFRMQITNFATACSLLSVALGAALDPSALSPGVTIHANGAPVAQSLSLTAEAESSAKRDVEK